MRIEFLEASRVGDGILEDFLYYKTVDRYVSACVCFVMDSNGGDREPNFVPLNCKFVMQGETYWILKGGVVQESAAKAIDILGKMPINSKRFSSDCLCVYGNGFEREIFFSWG